MTTLQRNSTGANRGRNLCSLRFLLFKFRAGKPELREDKAVFVVADKEVSQFSHEITVNCVVLV